jgi:hypothetical protein
MKITIRPLFGKIKNFATEYTKAFASMFTGVTMLLISAIYHAHAWAQLDLINVTSVWDSCETNILRYQTLLAQGFWRYAEVPFQDGITFRTNIGNAYDFFGSLLTGMWALGIIGMFFLMLGVVLFYRANMLEAKEILTNNGMDKPLFPEQ